jgi:hypothetical protein
VTGPPTGTIRRKTWQIAEKPHQKIFIDRIVDRGLSGTYTFMFSPSLGAQAFPIFTKIR